MLHIVVANDYDGARCWFWL